MDEFDRKYYLKWGWTRQKGKGHYILSRGLCYGLFLLVMRVTLDIFQMPQYGDLLAEITSEDYMMVLGGMAVLMILAGFVVAWCLWIGKENRFNQIVKDTPKDELPYLNVYKK